MADPNKFTHTWEMQKTSLLIRFYEFWYGQLGADASNLSFCKLFWSLVLSPLMVIFYFWAGLILLVIKPIIWLVSKVRKSPNAIVKAQSVNHKAKRAGV